MQKQRSNPTESHATALKDITAVILCGGLGTRLRSIVSDRPKSMALVAGRPFLVFLLEWLRGSGIREVVLCAGYKADAVREYFGDGSSYGLSLRYSIEPEPLGTAGALKLAEPYLKRGTFLVLNGDSAVELDLTGLLVEHIRHNATATMALVQSDQRWRYGRVWIDEEDKVIGFAEKEVPGSAPSLGATEWTNGGVYAFEWHVPLLIPTAPPAVSFETDLLPRLVGNGLFGFRSNGYFIDIGVPDDYSRAQEELPRRFGCVHSNSR